MNNKTDNSLFTEVKAEDAAQVNGGFLSSAAYAFSIYNINTYGYTWLPSGYYTDGYYWWE